MFMLKMWGNERVMWTTSTIPFAWINEDCQECLDAEQMFFT